MTLIYSGAISLGMIADEMGVSRSNVSLRGRSSVAGKGTPDAISEFYGYTQAAATFTYSTQIFGPGSSTVSGQVTTYKPNVTLTLTVFGGITTGGTAYGVLTKNSGVVQTNTVGAYQTTTRTIFIATQGTDSSSMSLYTSGQSSSAAYARVTAA